MNSPKSTVSAKAPLVLCIDDADLAIRVRILLLGYEGDNVLTASSGEEGLEIFKNNPVGLVIADHFLSGKSGGDVVREMQELKPEVPILIIPAWRDQAALSSRMDSLQKLNHLPFCLDMIA